MRQKDIITVVFVTLVSGVFAFLIGKFIFNYKADIDSIKTMAPISSVLEELDARYFHKDSINPTIRTVIGSEQDVDPQENETQ